MHHIYKTRAIILKSWPSKEANKNLLLLTKDLGVLYATVQGARKIESKMRQSIQDYSVADVALISARAGWKLINVSFISNFYSSVSSELSTALIRVFSLICKLVAGEIEDNDLFKLVDDFITLAIKYDKRLDSELIKSFEVIMTARLLFILGYFEKEKVAHFLEGDINMNLLKELESNKEISRRGLIQEINRSITESEL